jgi:hypothetical protein
VRTVSASSGCWGRADTVKAASSSDSANSSLKNLIIQDIHPDPA